MRKSDIWTAILGAFGGTNREGPSYPRQPVTRRRNDPVAVSKAENVRQRRNAKRLQDWQGSRQ